MPDKNRENFVVQQFLETYNSERKAKYVVLSRPEENSEMEGTYDFLCEDEKPPGNRLAIEEKSLHLFPINVRDNKVIRQLLAQVKEQVDKKGIIGNRQYFFFPDFRTTPKKKDRGKYVEKLIGIIEQAVREYRNTDIRKPISLPVGDLDGLTSLRLISARDHSGSSLEFPFHVHSNRSWNVSNDILKALKAVVVSANSSLEVPKRKGVRTVLLVTDCLAFGDGEAFRRAMGSIPPEIHCNIDEAFVINKNTFKESYSLCGIKESGVRLADSHEGCPYSENT